MTIQAQVSVNGQANKDVERGLCDPVFQAKPFQNLLPYFSSHLKTSP
jgi:hypothetical protein